MSAEVAPASSDATQPHATSASSTSTSSDAAPAAPRSKLSASAKPWGGGSFSFNPAAKSFVMATPEPALPPPPAQRHTYTTDEIFALEQPLYSGSSTLLLSEDAELGDILLYDPCFDYISAGLITAVAVDVPMDAGATGELGSMGGTGGEGPYDMLMPAGTLFAQQTTTGGKRPSPKKSKRTGKGSSSSSHTSPTKDVPAFSSTLADTPGSVVPAETNGTVLNTVVVEGRQLDAPPEGHDSEGEDEEEASEVGESDEEEDEESGEDGQSDEEEDSPEGQQQFQQPRYMQQQQIQYVWTPQAYGFAPGVAMSDPSAFQSGEFYPTAAPYYGAAAASASAMQEDSPFLAERRRMKQSQYFARQHAAAQGYGGMGHARSGGEHHFSTRGAASSRFAAAVERERAPDRERRMPTLVYDREQLLSLRGEPLSQERPANLPAFLSDIYKTSSSRSLFGNTAALTAAGASTRSVFGSAFLQPNPNHLQEGQDESDNGAAGPSGHPDSGLPPKRGGKLKAKRKKNKDRSARAIEDEQLIPPSQARAGGAHGPNGARGGSQQGGVGKMRGRIDSMDHGYEDERKEGDHGHGTNGGGGGPKLPLRGLSTPKHKPSKQKGKKGKKGAVEASPYKGGHNKRGNGNGGQLNSFQLDQFANATMDDLHHCENKWVPSIAAAAGGGVGFLAQSQADSLLHLQKQARSILNKLSIDNLPALLSSLLALPIDHAEALETVVDVLFDKSVDEPEFASLYARFCAELSPRLPEFTVHTGAAASSTKDGGATAQQSTSKTYSFRTLLLTRCYKLLVEDEETLRQSMYASALAAARARDSFSLSGNNNNNNTSHNHVGGGGSGSTTGSPRLIAMGLGGLVRPSSAGSPRSCSRSGSPGRTMATGGSPLRTGMNAGTGSPLRTHSPRLLSATTSPLIGASSSPLELPLVTSLELAEKLRVLQVHQRGNLIFIGELFKASMLPHSVVHLCVDALLDGNDPRGGGGDEGDDSGDEPTESDVEAVCTFLTCVGRKLEGVAADGEEEGAGADNGEQQQTAEEIASLRATRKALLDSHFAIIHALSRCRSLASRFRFMCQDLLELRARHWVPRIQKTVDPKSLAEMREQQQHGQTPMASPGGYGGPKGQWGQQGGPMTTVKKQPAGGRGFFAPAHNGMHHPNQSSFAGARTSVKGMRPGGGPSFGGGRALQFGHTSSPPMHRSVSAPGQDRELDLPSFPSLSPAAAAGGGPTSSGRGAPATSDGRYVPVWKRRLLGMDDASSGLLPRSVDAAADADADAEKGEDEALAAVPFNLEEGADGEADVSTADASAAATTVLPPSSSFASSAPSSSPSLSPSDLLQQLSVLVDELYSAHDLPEALQCLAEIEPHCASAEEMQREVVSMLLSKGVEQSQAAARALAPALLHALCDSGRMSPPALLAGLSSFLSLLPDISLDIPRAPAHTATILASLLRQARVGYRQLASLFAPLVAEEILPAPDAQAWIVDVLVQWKVQCAGDDEAERRRVQLLTDAAPAEPESDASAAGVGLAELFGGDRQAAQAALDKHDLGTCSAIL